MYKKSYTNKDIINYKMIKNVMFLFLDYGIILNGLMNLDQKILLRSLKDECRNYQGVQTKCTRITFHW
jgi:hypothetical protein